MLLEDPGRARQGSVWAKSESCLGSDQQQHRAEDAPIAEQKRAAGS